MFDKLDAAGTVISAAVKDAQTKIDQLDVAQINAAVANFNQLTTQMQGLVAALGTYMQAIDIQVAETFTTVNEVVKKFQNAKVNVSV